jgi:hypothetical protein
MRVRDEGEVAMASPQGDCCTHERLQHGAVEIGLEDCAT